MQIRHERVVWCGRPIVALRLTLALLGAMLATMPGQAAAQRVLTQPNRVVTLARGASALIQMPEQISRVSVGVPEIADYQVLPPRDLLINALTVGTTTILVWDRLERVEMISVVVTPDIGTLQRQIQLLFPDAAVTLSASGNAIIVSGQLRDPSLGRRILEVVRSAGGTVIDNLTTPAQRQVLLHVRFAEVNRTALSRLSANLTVTNPQNLGGALDNTSLLDIETLAEGVVRLFLLGDNGSGLEAVINALKTQGHFRSLAEPNLIAMEGEEATFLAGGEFPFPMVQGTQSGATGAVTISWKEFGVRLNFTPTITNIGTVRLEVMPEVSSLDFANGLTMAGFQIPALLTRRVQTSIELRPGQHLAIAGLLDNSTLTEWQKLPLLGDLPILGALFRSRSVRDRNTELLVLVTPHLVEPLDTPPEIPTGEPAGWNRKGMMRDQTLQLPAGVRLVPINRGPGQ